MRITQRIMADAVGISEPHLSLILSGIYEPGKDTAKKLGAFTGRVWTDFFSMHPDQIRAALVEAVKKQN